MKVRDLVWLGIAVAVALFFWLPARDARMRAEGRARAAEAAQIQALEALADSQEVWERERSTLTEVVDSLRAHHRALDLERRAWRDRASRATRRVDSLLAALPDSVAVPITGVLDTLDRARRACEATLHACVQETDSLRSLVILERTERLALQAQIDTVIPLWRAAERRAQPGFLARLERSLPWMGAAVLLTLVLMR